MASTFSLRALSNGATLTPPRAPPRKNTIGRFCVKVSTDVSDAHGRLRFVFKGYGPDEKIIKAKTIATRDTRCRADDVATEPLITTIPICDVCDNRVEVFDATADKHYFIL